LGKERRVMPRDWFRKTTWSKEDQEDFDARWKRCRTDWNRFQYLSIQAGHLSGAKPPLYADALKLLERALSDFHQPVGIANALGLKARCVHALSGFDQAAPIYRQALEFEKTYPKVRTQLWVEFPWEIVKARRATLYDDALRWLDFPPAKDVMFPIDRFRQATVLAIIADERRDTELAKSNAEAALRAAGMSHSPFPQHKNVGLVVQIESWAREAIDKILQK
jgi:hypothetical protein